MCVVGIMAQDCTNDAKSFWWCSYLIWLPFVEFILRCAGFYLNFLPLIIVISWKRAVYVKIMVFTVRVGSVIVYRSSWKYIIFCIVQPTDGAILPSHTVYSTALATYLLLQETHIFSVMFCVVPPDLSSCKLQHIRVKLLIVFSTLELPVV